MTYRKAAIGGPSHDHHMQHVQNRGRYQLCMHDSRVRGPFLYYTGSRNMTYRSLLPVQNRSCDSTYDAVWYYGDTGLASWLQPTSTPKRKNNPYKEQPTATPNEAPKQASAEPRAEAHQRAAVDEATSEDDNAVDDSFSSDDDDNDGEEVEEEYVEASNPSPDAPRPLEEYNELDEYSNC